MQAVAEPKQIEAAAAAGAPVVELHTGAYADCEAQGVLVNAVDQPEICRFITPSIVDRSPVLIAVGTGGASAGLAKALRLRLETLLPQGLGRLATSLFGAREALRARWPDAGERRRALDAALGERGVLDPLAEASADKVPGWLEDSVDGDPDANLEIVLASDHPDDLTLRQARLLGMADAVFHEPGMPGQILDRARADAVRVAIAPGEAAPPRSGLVVVLRKAED